MPKIVTKRMPWAGKGRQIKRLAVKTKAEKASRPPPCNCHKQRGKHAKTADCRS